MESILSKNRIQIVSLWQPPYIDSTTKPFEMCELGIFYQTMLIDSVPGHCYHSCIETVQKRQKRAPFSGD